MGLETISQLKHVFLFLFYFILLWSLSSARGDYSYDSTRRVEGASFPRHRQRLLLPRYVACRWGRHRLYLPSSPTLTPRGVSGTLACYGRFCQVSKSFILLPSFFSMPLLPARCWHRKDVFIAMKYLQSIGRPGVT